jgi:hypothetical protein
MIQPLTPIPGPRAIAMLEAAVKDQHCRGCQGWKPKGMFFCRRCWNKLPARIADLLNGVVDFGEDHAAAFFVAERYLVNRRLKSVVTPINENPFWGPEAA